MKKLMSLFLFLLPIFPLQGQIIEIYYQGGLLAVRGEIVDKAQQGFWEFFYQDGSIQERANWTNGKVNGAFQSYYPGGKLKLEGTYLKGNQSGLWKVYFKNGAINEIVNWKDNKLEGPFEAFYEDGANQSKGI